MQSDTGLGFKIIGKVVDIKGNCNAGHKIGDSFEISIHSTNRLCGAFYHKIYPQISLLQFGGEYPWQKDKDIVVTECPDHVNAVTLELCRIRVK